jgi:hypothetical protein
MEFKPTFEVMDLTENQTYIVDVAQEYLQEREDALNTRKQARIAIKNVLLSNLQTIHEYAKHWKAKEYDKDVYYVSGEGLGLSDGKLTSGMWNFRSDTGQIAPVDNEGLALFDFIMSP